MYICIPTYFSDKDFTIYFVEVVQVQSTSREPLEIPDVENRLPNGNNWL